jgi:hypothetical protein
MWAPTQHKTTADMLILFYFVYHYMFRLVSSPQGNCHSLAGLIWTYTNEHYNYILRTPKHLETILYNYIVY